MNAVAKSDPLKIYKNSAKLKYRCKIDPSKAFYSIPLYSKKWCGIKILERLKRFYLAAASQFLSLKIT